MENGMLMFILQKIEELMDMGSLLYRTETVKKSSDLLLERKA